VVEIITDWQPHDPIFEAAGMRQLALELEDFTPALEASKGIVIEDVRRHFEEQRGPTGEMWAEWAESYAPTAERDNIGKLRRRDTQNLYRAATDRMNYHVAGDALFLDTTGFPIYWAIQQYGGLIGSKHGGTIPERPYLGMSAEAEIAVVGIFDMWMTGEIIGWIEQPLRGPGVFQPRLKSGRFGAIPTL
jgi:phage gpG-like protein